MGSKCAPKSDLDGLRVSRVIEKEGRSAGVDQMSEIEDSWL